MAFLQRNLRNVQTESDFNSQGQLEIPQAALSEIVANALIHRSFIIKSPIRIFVFDNRVEIHSPGLLPEGVSVESLRKGVSRPVNELLFNHAIHLLPYTGVGTGILRAVGLENDIQMVNDSDLKEFVVTFLRQNSEMTIAVEVADDGSKTNQETNQETITKRLLRKELTGLQKNIINFCSVPRTAQEIMDHIGVSNQSARRKQHLQPLIEAGFIEMTNPEQKTIRNQRYKKK